MVLRAKKAHVLPITSADPHHQQQQHIQKRGPFIPTLLEQTTLQRVLRPGKRAVGETEDMASLMTFNSPKVLPPIDSGENEPIMARERDILSQPAVQQKKVRLDQQEKNMHVEFLPPDDQMDTDHEYSRNLIRQDQFQNDETKSNASRSSKRSSFRTEMDEVLAVKKFSEPFSFIEYLQSKPMSKDFVYLIMRQHQGGTSNITYNPYDLEIVDYSHVDKKKGYYTLSILVTLCFHIAFIIFINLFCDALCA